MSSEAQIQLNIHPEWIEILKGIFKPYLPDIQIWAYGSRLKKLNHSGSDLDLVIVKSNTTNTTHINFGQIRQMINDSNIPILIDIQDLETLPLSFQKEIKSHWIQLL